MSLASTAPLQSGSSTQSALAEPFEPASPQRGAGDKKSKMLGLFGLGKKKKTDDITAAKAPSTSDPSAKATKEPFSRRSTTSPMPSSPGRGGLSSSSPRLASPAGSQIFERDVQEAANIPNSPAIPSHIITENHVPPVLDASSEAITDNRLDPDSVEIITHANHQPAAIAVNGAGIPDHVSNGWQDDLELSSSAADLRPQTEPTDSGSNYGSNYGSLDNSDVRRLSFISFADVVQAEHQGHAGAPGSRESIHLAGLTSLSTLGGLDHRAASPIRSPVSSTTGGAGTSPPNSKSASLRGIDTSPSRKPLGSPVSTNLSMSPTMQPLGIPGEVNVETMTQAMRRTGSGDLSGGVKSHPTSPIDNAPSR